MRQPARETEIGCGDAWTRAPQRARPRAGRRATWVALPALTLAVTGPAPAPGAPSAPFERRDIAEFTAPYQLAVADVNGDKRLDVIALSTSAGRVDWF